MRFKGRSSIKIVTRGILVILTLWIASFFVPLRRQPRSTKWLNNTRFQSTIRKQPKRVLVRESQGFHDEVYTSFLNVLSLSNKIDTTISLRGPRFQITKILDQFQWKNSPKGMKMHHDSITQAEVMELNPNIVISITCGDDFREHARFYQALFDQTEAVLYCVIHHADLFQQGSLNLRKTKIWSRARRIRYITLSKHVKNTLQPHIGLPPVSVFPPIFEAKFTSNVTERKNPYFVMQGNLDSGRRNYQQVINLLREQARKAKESNTAIPHLYLLGQGNLNIPNDVTDLISIKSGLDYDEFYSILSGAQAILPGFADDQYYINKASSSIPASIIAGSPLIVSQRLMDCYDFLQEQSVIRRRDDESELKAAIDFISLPLSIRNEKLVKLKKLRKTLIYKNKESLENWISIDTA